MEVRHAATRLEAQPPEDQEVGDVMERRNCQDYLKDQNLSMRGLENIAITIRSYLLS